MRLIDADEALRLMSGWDWQDLYLPSHFKELVLDECETVDAEPVRHGKWVENGSGYDWYFECSECRCKDGYPIKDRYKYCPHCGAKMDLDKD